MTEKTARKTLAKTAQAAAADPAEFDVQRRLDGERDIEIPIEAKIQSSVSHDFANSNAKGAIDI